MTGHRTARRTAPAVGRIVRVAELIDADTETVRARAAELPESVSAAITELAAGTLLTLEIRPRWWDRRSRRLLLTRLQAQLAGIDRDTSRRTVVAAAIVAEHRLLVAQRSYPPELAGRWELPGGKLERGETARAALVRECQEELGATIIAGDELSRQRLPDGAWLVLLAATLAPGSQPPRARQHLALRWADADELPGLDWLATNRRYVADVTGRL